MSKKKLFFRKYSLAAIVILLLILSAVLYILLTQEQKPDPVSEKIIRQAASDSLFSLMQIKKAPNNLTDDDFANVTNFEIINKELSDIRLLEKFTNLQTLRLVGIHYPSNKIPKWMHFLAKYGLFNLEERFQIDLSPLANLNNLTSLDLNNTQISDIKPLANLTKLQVLYVWSTKIADIKPLANLTKLGWLEMSNTQVCDISVLVNLPNLKYLEIRKTEVTNTQIAELKKALPNLKIER